MTQDASLSVVREIMSEFAYHTGLSSEKEPQRYLWTDSFAVCNFLELHHRTGEERYKKLALLLVDQVHHVLGRHRKDDPRTGWISGLNEKEGENHPTKGGLRIGKELYEREPGEPYDPILEWERDGQYYHYLTKWMHALNRVSQATGDLTYNRWAMELAKTAHASFTYTLSGGQKRMYWKMSIDLTRPLVPSMGQHDPLDGLITYNELQATAPEDPKWPTLKTEIADIASICEGRNWDTDDPLGIGGLLCDAYRLAQLVLSRHFERADLLPILLRSSEAGLNAYLSRNPLDLPAGSRLAFRELGLSLGLRAVERLQGLVAENSGLFDEKILYPQIESLLQYLSLREEIEGFWLERTNRESNSWKEHRNINMVMLATSLTPDGYLRI
jgi:hypothetical protein